MTYTQCAISKSQTTISNCSIGSLKIIWWPAFHALSKITSGCPWPATSAHLPPLLKWYRIARGRCISDAIVRLGTLSYATCPVFCFSVSNTPRFCKCHKVINDAKMMQNNVSWIYIPYNTVYRLLTCSIVSAAFLHGSWLRARSTFFRFRQRTGENKQL